MTPSMKLQLVGLNRIVQTDFWPRNFGKPIQLICMGMYPFLNERVSQTWKRYARYARKLSHTNCSG